MKQDLEVSETTDEHGATKRKYVQAQKTPLEVDVAFSNRLSLLNLTTLACRCRSRDSIVQCSECDQARRGLTLFYSFGLSAPGSFRVSTLQSKKIYFFAEFVEQRVPQQSSSQK